MLGKGQILSGSDVIAVAMEMKMLLKVKEEWSEDHPIRNYGEILSEFFDRENKSRFFFKSQETKLNVFNFSRN